MVGKNIKSKIKSKLFRDSVWSVFGTGFGSGLLLLASIIIARFLGSDLYGEYGVVKSTMFYIAAFATFGLGVTSTKYIAQYVSENKSYLKSLIRDCTKITFFSSTLLAVLLVLFANFLADWLNNTALIIPLRFLGVIIICRAINMTQIGILGGLKEYKKSAINASISGLFMVVICVPLTYFFSLPGALTSLLFSQILNCVLNRYSIRKICSSLPEQSNRNFIKELLVFSFPVAIQESTYFIRQWGGLLILTRLSSFSEVGIFSASAQWTAVILFIPGMLYNVVVSHLSSHLDNQCYQIRIMKVMLAGNFISTFIPFLIILCLSGFISSFYGSSYNGMSSVLNIFVLSTVFTCCSNVFQSQMVAQGKNWQMLIIRAIKDLIFLGSAYLLIKMNNGINGAFYYVLANLITIILYFLILLVYTLLCINRQIVRR